MRLRKLSIALGGAALGVAVLGAIPALGADHRDAPLTKAAAKSDLNDLYAFTGRRRHHRLRHDRQPAHQPGRYREPLAGPGDELRVQDGHRRQRRPGHLLQAHRLRHRPSAGRYAAHGDRRERGHERHQRHGRRHREDERGLGRHEDRRRWRRFLYVGPRDDPFFFDLAGFQAGLKFTNPGVDTFKGTNVTAIVLELPAAPATKMGVWATTSKQDNLGNWVQLDRMGARQSTPSSSPRRRRTPSTTTRLTAMSPIYKSTCHRRR